jgi:hypothetical protein
MSRAPKWQSYPITGCDRASGLSRLRLPEFLYSRHMSVVKVSNEITRGTTDFRLTRRKAVRMNERKNQ